MTVQIRRDSEIYSADCGWFQARWHFSFDQYRDPEQMGVGPLRVFNDDRLQPGAVWPLHPHRDIKSCTYVAEGPLRSRRLAGQRRHAGGRCRPPSTGDSLAASTALLASRRPPIDSQTPDRDHHSIHLSAASARRFSVSC
jgi:hypothetical protein